jgi:hypothetical protein
LTTNDRANHETRCIANNQHTAFGAAPLVKRGQLFGLVHFEQLQKRIAPLRHALLHHPVYDAVDSLDRLRPCRLCPRAREALFYGYHAGWPSRYFFAGGGRACGAVSCNGFPTPASMGVRVGHGGFAGPPTRTPEARSAA